VIQDQLTFKKALEGGHDGAAVEDHSPCAAKRRLARPSLRCGRRGRFRPLRPAL